MFLTVNLNIYGIMNSGIIKLTTRHIFCAVEGKLVMSCVCKTETTQSNNTM